VSLCKQIQHWCVPVVDVRCSAGGREDAEAGVGDVDAITSPERANTGRTQIAAQCREVDGESLAMFGRGETGILKSGIVGSQRL
jgi:hypothetical protein